MQVTTKVELRKVIEILRTDMKSDGCEICSVGTVENGNYTVPCVPITSDTNCIIELHYLTFCPAYFSCKTKYLTDLKPIRSSIEKDASLFLRTLLNSHRAEQIVGETLNLLKNWNGTNMLRSECIFCKNFNCINCPVFFTCHELMTLKDRKRIRALKALKKYVVRDVTNLLNSIAFNEDGEILESITQLEGGTEE